jgi:hypothetical protein
VEVSAVEYDYAKPRVAPEKRARTRPAWRLPYGTACYGCAMCNEADEDEQGLICQIASDIRDGKADPEQARRLLRHFLDCTERGRPDQKVLPDPLLEFFRYVFTVYLKDPQQES